MRSGWLKGMEAAGPFTIVSGTNQAFEIKLDADPTWRHIDITPETYSGDALADWLEAAIRDLEDVVSSSYQLAYMNMSVKYEDGRFQFVSGSVSEHFTGSLKSSVEINNGTLLYAPGENVAPTVGLDFPTTTESLASFEAKEGRVNGSYTAGSATLNIKDYGWDATTFSGSVFTITDDNFEVTDLVYDDNSEYFICIGGTASALTVMGADGTAGLVYNYSDGDKIIMFSGPQDPQATPTAWHSEVDSVVRWGIKTVSNQIEFDPTV